MQAYVGSMSFKGILSGSEDVTDVSKTSLSMCDFSDGENNNKNTTTTNTHKIGVLKYYKWKTQNKQINKDKVQH